MRKLLLLFPCAMLAACNAAIGDRNNDDDDGDAPQIVYLNAPGTEDANLPFSSAVRVDDLLFLSGAIGIVPGTMTLAEGGIQGETRQTLLNIRDTLENFGSSMDRVVKCTVFLADMDEWGQMNEVYRSFFPNPPARSALGASGLALDARVEIECIAVMN